MTDDLSTRISDVIIGQLIRQAESRNVYFQVVGGGGTRKLVTIDSAIDPLAVADAVIREMAGWIEWAR